MGILISDRISYRNHYICSDEATSEYRNKMMLIMLVDAVICIQYRSLCIYSYGEVVNYEVLLTKKLIPGWGKTF